MPTKQRYERRLDAADFRLRSESEDKPVIVEGYAAKFDEWTTLSKYSDVEVREIIRSGAFKNAIAEAQDVRALIDHNPSLLLGRTQAGTLELSEDEVGLFFRLTLAKTQAAQDLVENLRLGNLSQCSFAFSPRSNGEIVTTRQADGLVVTECELIDVDLYDISIVAYPAYPNTTVSVANRSRDLIARAGKSAPKTPSGRKAKTRKAAALKVVDHFLKRNQ